MIMQINHVRVTTIERLDQGHLYPLGEHRDKHVTVGARTSDLLHRRLPLYLKSYLDSLFTDYSEPLHGSPSACVVHFGCTWTYLEGFSGLYVGRLRIIAVVWTYDFYPNSTNGHADQSRRGHHYRET